MQLGKREAEVLYTSSSSSVSTSGTDELQWHVAKSSTPSVHELGHEMYGKSELALVTTSSAMFATRNESRLSVAQLEWFARKLARSSAQSQ